MKHKPGFLWLISIVLASLCVLNACAKNKAAPAEDISKYTKEMREAVSINVTDKTRRDQVLRLIAQMETVMQDFNMDIETFVDQYRVLDTDHGTSRQSYNSLIEDFSNQRKLAQEKLFDLHFAAVALMTKDEWDQVVEYEKNAVAALIQSRGPDEDVDK